MTGAVVILSVVLAQTQRDQSTTQSNLVQARANAVAADNELAEIEAENERLATDAETAWRRYRELRADFMGKVTRAKQRAYSRGRSLGWDLGRQSAFGRFAESFDAGQWYIVRIGRRAGHMTLASSVRIHADSGVRYAVEDGGVSEYAATPPSPPPPSSGGRACHPSYSGCLDPSAYDYDCAGGSGDGPLYTGFVEVYGYDEYGLDANGDGFGCE